ncbi:HNH endonuclease [Catalinimonas sp. 4WD22]|uniref:HNH endonuclease n=1 Tax=Catalinimonas locisalis TaxID=3133978 RepID=UPI0031010A52
MRFIQRLPKPDILERKEESWRERFVNSDNPRPSNKQYAHQQIRDRLNTMSFHKCFYCERKLKDVPQEVDHFIEVAERKDLAFDWDNLYLACDNCNNKKNNLHIPVTEALDPCRDSDDIIQEHLIFEDEIIRTKNGSQLGLRTIQKFKLNSDQLDKVRLTQIKYFEQLLSKILIAMHQEARGILEQEKEALLSFKNPDRPFSLMFKVMLDKYSNLLDS